MADTLPGTILIVAVSIAENIVQQHHTVHEAEVPMVQIISSTQQTT